MPASDKRILLGHISAAHGIRGEVLIKSLTGDPAAVASYGQLTDEARSRRFEIKVVRVTQKGVIARIRGIGDRTAAEALRGVKLYIDRQQLPPAEDGEFYHTDLIGLTAFATDGSEVGEVVAVQNFGAGDLLEVRLHDSAQTELVPFDRTFTPEVDITGGRVVVVLAIGAEDDEDDIGANGSDQDTGPS